MYRGRMSSFDDAIRQHLDLKRRQGADPHELARLEREAFNKEALADAEFHTAPRFDGVVRASRSEAAGQSDGDRRDAGRSALSQETVEIDMGAFIDARRIEDDGEHRAYDWSADLSSPDVGDPTGSFEWETPPRSRIRGAA
jgi:hypothetical protein